MDSNNDIKSNVYEVSSNFAIRIVKLYKFLRFTKDEVVMSKQLLRAGTSIGANVYEGKNAQSRADFTHKMNIALKEASETEYWLNLLYKTDYLKRDEYESIIADCNHITAILTKIVKSTKN